MFKSTVLFTAISLFSVSGLLAQHQANMKSINQHAPVTCSKNITINASADKVWSVLTAIDNWASWQTDISYARLNSALQPNTTFDWKTGGAKIHSTLHAVNTNTEFGWTGKTFGMYAIHNWTLKARGGATEVQVDESMEGFLASLFKRSFNNNLEKGMEKWLQLLKHKCEAVAP